MSFYFWLGEEAEQYAQTIPTPLAAEEVEDDGWITLFPRVA